jgi:hypothetical protein
VRAHEGSPRYERHRLRDAHFRWNEDRIRPVPPGDSGAGTSEALGWMADIRKRSPVLADLGVSGAIKIVGAMYNLETGCWSSSNYVPVCGRSASQTEG